MVSEQRQDGSLGWGGAWRPACAAGLGLTVQHPSGRHPLLLALGQSFLAAGVPPALPMLDAGAARPPPPCPRATAAAYDISGEPCMSLKAGHRAFQFQAHRVGYVTAMCRTPQGELWTGSSRGNMRCGGRGGRSPGGCRGQGLLVAELYRRQLGRCIGAWPLFLAAQPAMNPSERLCGGAWCSASCCT